MKINKKLKEKLFNDGISKLIDWTDKKRWDVEFDYCLRDEMSPSDRLITINTRQGIEKQLYSFLHECGHVILHNNEKLYEKKYPSSTKMACFNKNIRLERSPKYKVDVLIEEIDAWRKGKELANRLEIYIDEDKYYSLRAECLYSYIKSLSKP